MEYPTTISESLLSTASWHARAAFSKWNSEDFHEALQASVSIGTSAELLLKHLISLKSTSFLADLQPKNRNAVIVTRQFFESNAYRDDLWKIHSCSAEDARFVHHELDKKNMVITVDDFKLLMGVRNAASHLSAIAPLTFRRKALFLLLEMFEKSNPIISGQQNPFEGIEHAVIRFKQDYRQDSLKIIDDKIKLVKDRYSKLSSKKEYEKGSEPFRGDAFDFLNRFEDEYFDSQEGWQSQTRPHHAYMDCPTCEYSKASMLYESEGELFDVEGEVPEIYEYGNVLFPIAMSCAECGTSLTLRELRTLADEGRSWAKNASTIVNERSGHYSDGRITLD